MLTRIISSQYPVQSLVLGFIVWKALLLLIAVCSPGPGYDTSTTLSLVNQNHKAKQLHAVLIHLINKLTRWDAIYFVKVASRGYLFEQEWAFGWGFSKLISLCSTLIQKAGLPYYEGLEGLVAIVIAHLGHLSSVLVLHRLTLAIFPESSAVAATSAAFHIISPAGLFLSAPYAESSCALLSFLGCFLFTKSLSLKKESSTTKDLLVLVSGILFGIATTFRSNAILNGLLLLEEAFRTLLCLKDGLHFFIVRRLVATGLGGLVVGLGFLFPQYLAYSEYCVKSTDPKRIWCERSLPSIYDFVQSHYWNVGPFRYWTVSNIPLFLLATPIFFIMIKAGIWGLNLHLPTSTPKSTETSSTSTKMKSNQLSHHHRKQVLRNLAIAQLLLTTLTLTTAHAQIITRISSAYPVWVWYLATSRNEKDSITKGFITFMVVYSLVQGGLFASFLPPA